jgi:hypothetical protein
MRSPAETGYACRTRTERYSLWTSHNGAFVLLQRHADGATAHFQDDDAVLWDDNMTAIENIKDWRAGNSFDASFNFLCSGYDDILINGD